MPDREEKHSILSSRHADLKEHGLFAALEALKTLNTSPFSTDELTQQITARIRSALKTQCAAIWLANDLNKTISMRAYTCINHIEVLPKNYFYNLDKPSAIADCLKKNKCSLIKKYTLAENDPRSEVLTKNLAAALLPLPTPGGVIGVLELIIAADDAITGAELESLEVLASQIALLLSNHQNSEHASRQSALQNQLYEISAKINQAKDYSSILQITVEELCGALNLPAASMHVNMAASAKPAASKEQSL